MSVISWDKLFMTMVYLVAMKSKDAQTHIGAVVVGPDHEIRSTGYNSFVRDLDDSLETRQERPEKYFWFEHAERNAIYNATLMGVSLKNCTMYTNGIPCMDCGRAVVQSGIKHVVVDKWWDKDNSAKWTESANRTLQMFKECEVAVKYYDGDFIDIHRYRRGETFDL